MSVDLDKDGVEDRIIGAPFADGRSKGSGVVIVLRGLAMDQHVPWYWFGQAY